MAIISIPSSIGGVTIPGGLVSKGPLGALFGNKYSVDNLQYPRDLESATRGHIVKFSINEVTPQNYSEIRSLTLPSDINLSNAWNKITDFGKDVNAALGKVVDNVNLSLNSPKKRIAASISLYMPDTMNFQYQASWNKLSVAEAIKDAADRAGAIAGKLPIVGSLASATTGAISGATDLATNSDAAKLTLASQGLAINPKQQLLFDGIDFRTYQLAFTFTPYSKEEAEQVKKIIQLFREHAAPRITKGAGGMFFVPPSTFDIDFLFNGQRNKNVNKVAESVITNIDINYSPNGWSTYDDGAPIQTTMVLDLQEITLIDRAKVKEGY